MTPADRWADRLAGWTIPKEILAVTPGEPWSFPPSLFDARSARKGAAYRAALSVLSPGESVLDVGCGGGAASIILAPRAQLLIGVDNLAEMLVSFAAAADEAGVAHREVLGRWPEVAPESPHTEVVVCRNVVYNVSDIVAFVTALTDHARKRVVVELPQHHPSVPLRPLWRRFWDLDRPDGPDAALFTELITELGFRPKIVSEVRSSIKASIDPQENLAFFRRRLCLDESRDSELADAVSMLAEGVETTTVVLSWAGRA